MTFKKLLAIAALAIGAVSLYYVLDAPNPSAPRRIFVLGDSHTKAFEGTPHCIIHHLGPITMHRVGRDRSKLFHLTDFGIKDGDAVVFVFGEIDARCHIGKQRDLFKRDLREIIQTLVKSYLGAIAQHCADFHIVKIVYSVIPATDGKENPDYPFWGSLEERAAFVPAAPQALAPALEVFALLGLGPVGEVLGVEPVHHRVAERLGQ